MNARKSLAALLSLAVTSALPGTAYCAAFAQARIAAPVGAAFGFQAAAAHVPPAALAAPTLPGSAFPNALSLPLPTVQAPTVAAPIIMKAAVPLFQGAASARPQTLPEQDLLGEIGANERAAGPDSGAWAVPASQAREHYAAVAREATGRVFQGDPTRAAADWGRFFDGAGTRLAVNGVASNAALPAVKVPKLELSFNLSKDGYRVQPEHVEPFKTAWAGQSKEIITFAAESFVTGGLKKLNREGNELFVYYSGERSGGAVIYAVKFVSKKGIYLSAAFYLTLEKNGRFTIKGDD
ncbi:MAG: hypothetical protein FD126_715 [Elusimicrobia bacterium]|nr:MAG: hypothetical protein FD126_715 [Elusimicrobiota bacterium]